MDTVNNPSAATPETQTQTTTTEFEPVTTPPQRSAAEELRFDPIAKPGQQGRPDAVPKVETNAVPGQKPTGTPAVVSPDIKSQADQIKQLLSTQALQQPQQPLPQQPQPGQETDPHDWQPGFKIPDELFAAVTSQDPNVARQGISAMINGTAKVAYQQALNVTRQYVGQLTEAIPQMIQAHLAQAELQRSFYGVHKDLNNPQIKPTVMKVAETIAGQYRAQGRSVDPMDSSFQALVAYTTREILNIPQPQGQQVPARNGSLPQETFVATPGSRPAGIGHRQEDIADSLGLDIPRKV